ncbi:hypothetical protein ACP70R_007410 [Stipagrostis hirtigluma subsp. patula]
MEAKAEAAAAVGGAAVRPPGAPRNRLTRSEVRDILSEKPREPPPRYAALKRSNPELTPRPGEEMDEERKRLYVLTKGFYAHQERLPKLQAWVREQMEAKGYVEIDDEWAKRRADTQALLDREWPRLRAMLKAMVLEDDPEWHSDDEEEEEDDGDAVSSSASGVLDGMSNAAVGLG